MKSAKKFYQDLETGNVQSEDEWAEEFVRSSPGYCSASDFEDDTAGWVEVKRVDGLWEEVN